MGQHLHLYAAQPSEISVEEARAWCKCRTFELTDMPAPGFEQKACDKVERFMRSHTADNHLYVGLSWSTSVWASVLWWKAYPIDDDLIQRVKETARNYDNSNCPKDLLTYMIDEIVTFLQANRGKTGWGDNDGI